MPNVPLKSQNAINALHNNDEIDPDLIEAIDLIYTDLQTLKSNLYGLGRDGSGDLGFDNPSFRNKIGDQRAMTLTKDGILNLGFQYGVRPDVMMNVKGSIYGVPQWGRWQHTAGYTVGNLNYVWSLEKFNNTYDLYQRQAGNTQIRIIVPGDYLVTTTIGIYGIHLLTAATFIIANLSLNGTSIKAYRLDTSAATPPAIAWFTVTMTAIIQTTANTDYVSVSIGSGAPTAIGYVGDPTTPYSTLEICKLN